jgi:hypothetical protein
MTDSVEGLAEVEKDKDQHFTHVNGALNIME